LTERRVKPVEEEIGTVMQARPAFRFSDHLEILDRSLGLISHPGYRSHIERQISDKVLESARTALAGSTP
jgi:hypothetical protein